MEFVLLSQKKIKIVLDTDDIKRYKLNIDNLDYNLDKTRNIIKEMLNKAREQTGFEVRGDKIFVQAYPLADGRCEIYISKLGDNSDNNAVSSDIQSNAVGIVSVFECLNDIAEFSQRICKFKIIGNDCIFYDHYTNHYVLTFDLKVENNKKDIIDLISAVVCEHKGAIRYRDAQITDFQERYVLLSGVHALELFSKLYLGEKI